MCKSLSKKLNEYPELLFPLGIFIISLLILFLGILCSSVIPDYKVIGDTMIFIGGIFSFIIGACLFSVWDGKYREKKKTPKVTPIHITINTHAEKINSV